MAKYECTLIYDASFCSTVEADSIEAAVDAAGENADASLCHQCSARLNLGDVQGVIVYQDGAEVADTTYSGEEIARLRALNAGLLEALERMASVFMPYPSENTEQWREEHEACEMARAAIAKARGN